MKNILIKVLLVTGALLFAGSQAVLATPITISDGVYSGTGWYGNHEDQEVEPGCITDQAWDLESFDLTGTRLTLTGGWNFRSGYQGNASGDIFIDVNGNAVYGQDVYSGSNSNGNQPDSNGAYRYDYVVHFTDRGDQAIGGNYQVYRINEATTVGLTTPFYRQNDPSSPWVYVSGGQLVTSGTAAFTTFGDGQGTHYTMAVDVGFLGSASDVLFKFTMECGNDNMIGRGNVSVPDGGMTAMLLGMGLIGLAAIKRRLQN